ncbi:hypothetical protein O6H91_12G067700 [Diphasiastrum complanatum]|uniref:Uncharacterized protein n=1 Tax=Diphasiastrum complanatum TaxID=34168 RepID=A0ACC2C2Z8_DIPCM|nr:hypothetical protein O6H91_12G067700 [Diphasiastrum complanatum]
MDIMDRERERDRHRAVERLRELGMNNGRLMDEIESERGSARLSDREMFDRLGGRNLERKRLMDNGMNMDRDREVYEKAEPMELDRDKGEEKVEEKSSLRFPVRVNVLERMRALDREREEERERMRERAREEEREGDKERAGRDEVLQELVSQYKTALGELTFNSKPIITNLTIIAGENVHAAKGIAGAVCTHILEVPKEQKLPSLYLLDSIVKNIGGDYVRYFAARLPEVFCKSYRQVDPTTHSAMQHLFRTWRGVFPASPLRKIEVELDFPPQSNGPSTTTLQTKSVDSSSQRTGHGIHVNPKYIEAQRQRLQQTSRVEVAPVEKVVDVVPRELERSLVHHESTKVWPDSAVSRSSMLQRPQRVDAFGKIGLGQESASEHSDQNVGLDSPGTEVASRRGIDRDILGDRNWTLDREEFGKGERASDAPSSQRNGFDWRRTPTRGSPMDELRSSRLGGPPLFSQSSEAVDKSSRRSIGNWPNSEEEEEYVWDEISSSRDREHDSGIERREDWNTGNLDKSLLMTGPARGIWPKLQTDFPETLDWRRHPGSPHLEQPLGFDDRLPPFQQELDSRLRQSNLMKGLGGLQEPISGMDLLATSHLKPGHHPHAVRPPLSTLQHLGPPAQSRLRPLQVTVPGRSASLSVLNNVYLPQHSDSAIRSPTRLGSSFFGASSSLQNFYQTNSAASLGMGSPTIGNLSPVTPASSVALQSLSQRQPPPPFPAIKFSSQHIPPLPPIPPPPIPPTSQQQLANTINPSQNQAPILPFHQMNPLRPVQVSQPFSQSQGVLPPQEVAMPGQTLQGLEPPPQGSQDRQQSPSVLSMHEAQPLQGLQPPHIEALPPLPEAQQQQKMQPVQPPPQSQQPQTLQPFLSQPTQPPKNLVSGVLPNGPTLGPALGPVNAPPQDQPHQENLLAAFLKSGLMPPAQNSLFQSQPQPSSTIAVGSFMPGIVPPLQAQPPLPTGPPPFQFSAPIVNPMTAQTFSSALSSSNSVPPPPPVTSLGTYPQQPIRNPQPPLPPGPPPPFTLVASGAMQPAALGESGSVNQLSSLLSSLVARGLISAPSSTTASTTISVAVSTPPQTFLPALQSSDFSFLSSEVPQVSAVSTTTVPIIATSSIPMSVVVAPHDSDNSQPVDVVGTEFKLDFLKERHEFVIDSLYSDFPRQCKTCGLRFNAQEDHSKHMDWHVARNRRQKSQKTVSRKWFVTVKEWLGGTGVSSPVVAPFFAEEVETKVEEQEILAVPADENQSACALCQEPFEDFYSDETEEWMYKGAVYLKVSPGTSAEGLDSSLRGPIVHAKCKSESAATVGIGYPDDVKEEDRDHVKSRKRVRY